MTPLICDPRNLNGLQKSQTSFLEWYKSGQDLDEWDLPKGEELTEQLEDVPINKLHNKTSIQAYFENSDKLFFLANWEVVDEQGKDI